MQPETHELLVTEINWDRGCFSNERWYQCEQHNPSLCVASIVHIFHIGSTHHPPGSHVTIGAELVLDLVE